MIVVVTEKTKTTWQWQSFAWGIWGPKAILKSNAEKHNRITGIWHFSLCFSHRCGATGATVRAMYASAGEQPEPFPRHNCTDISGTCNHDLGDRAFDFLRSHKWQCQRTTVQILVLITTFTLQWSSRFLIIALVRSSFGTRMGSIMHSNNETAKNRSGALNWPDPSGSIWLCAWSFEYRPEVNTGLVLRHQKPTVTGDRRAYIVCPSR